MTNWTVEASSAGARLDAWLSARPEIGSRGKAREAIACGKIYLNKAEATFDDAGRRLVGGDQVGFWPDRPGSSRPRRRDIVSARRSLAVVYEDEAIVVVNKPPGWLVEPLPGEEAGEATLRDLLEDRLRDGRRPRPLVVHRIDRDTSGLVLFALTPAARDALKGQFERHTPERTYLAVVNGRPVPPRGTWRDRLVWDKERLVQKRAHAEEERGQGRGGALPGRRAVRLPGARRGVAGDREAEPDSGAGRLARARARRRTAVPVRAPAGRGARAGVRPAGVARRPPRVHPSGHAAARGVHRGAAGRPEAPAPDASRHPRRTTTKDTEDTEAFTLRASAGAGPKGPAGRALRRGNEPARGSPGSFPRRSARPPGATATRRRHPVEARWTATPACVTQAGLCVLCELCG